MMQALSALRSITKSIPAGVSAVRRAMKAIVSAQLTPTENLLPQEEKMINFQLATYGEIDFNPHEDFIIYFEYGQAAFVTREQKTPLERTLSRNVLKNYLESLVY